MPKGIKSRNPLFHFLVYGYPKFYPKSLHHIYLQDSSNFKQLNMYRIWNKLQRERMKRSWRREQEEEEEEVHSFEERPCFSYKHV